MRSGRSGPGLNGGGHLGNLSLNGGVQVGDLACDLGRCGSDGVRDAASRYRSVLGRCDSGGFDGDSQL